MALLFTADQLPATSADAIREFDERYLAGVSAVEPDTWPEIYGDVFDVAKPDVTLPIGLMSTKYEETRGESRARTMEEIAVRLKTAEYDAGEEAKLIDLLTNTFAYRKWSSGPARFIAAEKRLLSSKIAALIEANGITGWDGVSFFHASNHLANPSDPSVGTFGNLQSTPGDPTDIAVIQAEITAMMGVPDENGYKMGVYPTHMFLPTEKYEAVKNKLGQEFHVAVAGDGATNNPYKGVITPVHVKEFDDTNDWYLVDSNIVRTQAIPPWVAIRFFAAALNGLRVWDENSDFGKNTSKIKVSSHIFYGFSLLFPHAIRKVVGA